MARKSFLALAALVVAAAAAAIPAGAERSNGRASTPVVFRSFECKSRVMPAEPETWGCATLTVNPYQVDAGGTTAVTYAFRAKKTLKYVKVCVSRVNTQSCGYSHKIRKLMKGRTFEHVITVAAPAVSESGLYPFDNYTRFYKPPKYAHRWAYWLTHSHMCIIAAAQPNYQCPAR
jgi:hypothetical protein